MRLSRANIPLASENRTHSQAISPSPHYNLAPHFRPGFINLQHFCHSRWRNTVRLSKSGLTSNVDFSYAGNNPTWNITGAVYLPHASIGFSGAINKSQFGASCLLFVV